MPDGEPEVNPYEQLKQEILQLRDKGHTIIFSTHNMSSVEEICDEMALINHSQVVLSGDVNEVKKPFPHGPLRGGHPAG